MDKDFYKEIDEIFHKELSYIPKYVIRVKDVEKNSILTLKDMNYKKVMFDSELNMYKYENGWIPVNNKKFQPVVIEKIEG
jgi:hypothetical protein